MLMHESLASTSEGTNRIHLSGLLSEWLFSSKFWSNFNAKHGTMFDQFEEDEADIKTVKAIVNAIHEVIDNLDKSEEHNIEFTYRWTVEHKPLKASIQKESLMSELAIFYDFLVDAVTKKQCIIFSL